MVAVAGGKHHGADIKSTIPVFANRELILADSACLPAFGGGGNVRVVFG